VTAWSRCDAECSPARGLYYHPSRHSAGQPIIAGWAFQWIAQLGFVRDSWTAPVDAARLHPLDDTDQQAAGQIRALLGRLPAGGPMPLFVFDGGYDSAQLTLDLAGAGVVVLARLRSDRCCYADPPPRPPGAGGRPRRHGAKFAFADPATWPAPTTTLVTTDDQDGTVTVKAWAGLHPKQHRHPATAAADHGRSCAAPSSASTSSESPPGLVHPRWGGGGGPAPASSTGAGVARLHWQVRPGAHGQVLQADPGLDHAAAAAPRAGRAVDLAGAGRLHPAAPGPPARGRSAAALGAAPPARAAVALPGPPRGFAPAVHAGVAGCRAETLRALARSPQRPPLRPRPASPGDHQAHHQAHQEARKKPTRAAKAA
jgi:hypothetical protein